MAVFNKNTLAQVAGYSNPIISAELVFSQKTYLGLTIKDSLGAAVDLTGATIDAQILRRAISNFTQTGAGIAFDISDYTPTPTPITMTITNRVDANGTFSLIIDDTAWGIVATDETIDIASINPTAFSGRIKISIPAVGVVPQDDLIIFLLFLVRSDGVVN